MGGSSRGKQKTTPSNNPPFLFCFLVRVFLVRDIPLASSNCMTRSMRPLFLGRYTTGLEFFSPFRSASRLDSMGQCSNWVYWYSICSQLHLRVACSCISLTVKNIKSHGKLLPRRNRTAILRRPFLLDDLQGIANRLYPPNHVTWVFQSQYPRTALSCIRGLLPKTASIFSIFFVIHLIYLSVQLS